ncbi:MAG: PD-(D/E)XK nuclease family protein [Candidatus Desulfofervidus auxilii]|nr:PD-(D/E)XK nuclease family protein [Candidatus Desulfofervidus auxilii]
MTRKELIQELRQRGIDKVYGRALSRCLKSELESYYHRLQEEATMPHLSVSQINMYLRCGLQYFYRYVMGMKLPPAGAMVLGGGVHKVIEEDYKEKKEKGQNKALSEKQDMFVEEFKERIKEAELREDEKPEEMEKQGVGLIKVHHEEVAIATEPLEVEQPFEIHFEGKDYSLIGRIDLVTIEGVIDHKTASRKYNQNQVETDLQLPIYSFVTGINDVGFDVLVKTKKPAVQKIRAKCDEAKAKRVKAYIAKVAEAIERQVFLPAQPGSWVCSPKWCGYWEICHKDLG